MGKIFEQIDAGLRKFIEAQKLFFVATAPLSGEGRVNLSPKGLDTLRVLGPHRIAYLDLTGSGVETIAHLRENGRIVVMLCAFEGAPKILRLHGRGRVVEPGCAEFDELAPSFPELAGTRALIVVDVERIADSCGYGVPRYTLEGPRDTLLQWAERKGDEEVARYRQENNARSIDGLPGMDPAPR